MPVACVTDATDRLTDRVDKSIYHLPLVPLTLKMPTCNQVGFLLLKGDQGRAPSAPPSFPPKSIRRQLTLQLRAWEGLGRGKGESRVRTSEAREFRSRRRLQKLQKT